MASTPSFRAPTIGETVSQIRFALRDYIEATYHVGHPALVAQRRELLGQEGVLYQTPYLESTPRYVPGPRFEDLTIPQAARDLLASLAVRSGDAAPLLHNPPYTHQAEALEQSIGKAKSLIVTTGTGSGKTESFLLPILAKLAIEATEAPIAFAQPGVRAILLYPMNALVNDQLGRLRLLFGDRRVSGFFQESGGRPARFARYTSRTLYPGVRTVGKDQSKLKSIDHFYVSLLQQAADTSNPNRKHASSLIDTLRERGKWPAKPDLAAWYGASGSKWTDKDGNFKRAVTLPQDAELLTRHEVLANPPDVLVTNYSMLEYMMMRPLEQPIFDATGAWLDANPDDRLILVVDEAHLYRGAGGAEVGLLLRRLRSRLGISQERLQVIATSASFADTDRARSFAAQLTGKAQESFANVKGSLDLRPHEAPGTAADAHALAAVALKTFYEGETEQERLESVKPFLEHIACAPAETVERSLFLALEDFPPIALLINLTMLEATPVRELGRRVFPEADPDLADQAVTVLIALASVARPKPEDAGMLPCRVHAFFRGLPGLWACLDPECKDGRGDGSPIGAMFAQPRDSCDCGARVFELYTCRNCGTAYARAYCPSLDQPDYLWQEPGARFVAAGGPVSELHALDLLLEEPADSVDVEPADLDLVTGRLNPPELGDRVRQVFLNAKRTVTSTDDEGEELAPTGEFRPCGACAQTAGFGRTSVQDHQTKGDEPFQAIITRQLEVQPPGPQRASDFAPLRGRKVLTFSDSRQTAARLAPNLQTYSTRDALRPLILRGWRALDDLSILAPTLSLEQIYLAALIGAHQLGVRVRPELRVGESSHAMTEVQRLLRQGALDDPSRILELLQVGSDKPPEALLAGIYTTIVDRFWGLRSLGLASVRERANLQASLSALPDLGSLADTDDKKLKVTRLWLGQWATGPGIWFQGMDNSWWKAPRKRARPSVSGHSGRFQAVDRWLADAESRNIFRSKWVPELINLFTEVVAAPTVYRVRAVNLSLDVGGEWAYCEACRTTQRPFPGTTKCIVCGRNRVREIDPDEDEVFVARKGYYRNSAKRALAEPPDPPIAIIAAEHTAQLGAAQAGEVFSRAEQHELLFQDVDLGMPAANEQPRAAIDVLSCTTTMEVGIDIGALSGVALRNMPPSRASYQQRSGRAGRRGNAVATVVAFGSADSHDEHYFREPDAMIRGPVDDPALTLDNAEIARRHVTAYLLQRYHRAMLPSLDPEHHSQLFEVLGSVESFLSGEGNFTRLGFRLWLDQNETELVSAVDDWLPAEIPADERSRLLEQLVPATMEAIDPALDVVGSTNGGEAEDEVIPVPGTEEADDAVLETPEEQGEERPTGREGTRNLLDRLLYSGVLPRYAFPTDVVAFYVFDTGRSTPFRPAYLYAPSQGLPIALSQYAPGKEVWIDGKLWSSGALYSPYREDRFRAWQDRKLYLECEVCRYARTDDHGETELGERFDCPACGTESSFGRARNWLRPPGFAHPQSLEEGTSPDDQPARSYATRAKLVASTPADDKRWRQVSARVRQYYDRTHLLVTNTGPGGEGYSYCVRCGLIEPSAAPSSTVTSSHQKPYPDERDQVCAGNAATHGLVLGTDFISDVLLLGFRVDQPMMLRPGHLATDVALRTLADAITIAAVQRIDIDRSELQAEYRPALTPGGREGLEAEIYLYDTLAGGAGFSRRVGDVLESVLEIALSILEDCPANCDRSCYRCLRSFGNRFEHALLDRHLGASLLRYLVHGEEPKLDEARMDAAAQRLFQDLSGRGIKEVDFALDREVDVPGLGRVRAPLLVTEGTKRVIVGIHGPLTPDYAATLDLRDAKEFGTGVPILLVDELVVARNLPHATREVLEAIHHP